MLSEENGKGKEGRKGSSGFGVFSTSCWASPHSEKWFRDLFMLEILIFPISYKIYF